MNYLCEVSLAVHMLAVHMCACTGDQLHMCACTGDQLPFRQRSRRGSAVLSLTRAAVSREGSCERCRLV